MKKVQPKRPRESDQQQDRGVRLRPPNSRLVHQHSRADMDSPAVCSICASTLGCVGSWKDSHPRASVSTLFKDSGAITGAESLSLSSSALSIPARIQRPRGCGDRNLTAMSDLS